MNIACIAADLVPGKLGGAEVHAVEVIKRLAKKHHITLFVGHSDACKTIFSNNVTVVPIKYPRIPNLYGVCYVLWGYNQIKQYIVKHPADILWAKQCYPQAIVAAWLKQTLRIPLYITAQNPNLVMEELVIKGSVLRPLLSFFAGIINAGISWSFKQSDHVAAVSEYSKKAAHNFGASQISVIPNGYDDKTMRSIKQSKKDHFTILTTSSLIPRNGIDTLIKAVSLLPESTPWQLIIAGDGPELEKLQQLNYTLNPNPSRVTFLGRVTNQQIPSLLQSADVFVRPSRWEGFGVSFVEAMACGVPIIGTPVGGIPDFLIPDRTGLSVPVDNVTALTHGITKLMNDNLLREKLIKNAQAFVESRYTWDIIASQVEQTLTSLNTHHLNPKPLPAQAGSTLIVTPIFPPEIGGPATYVPEVAARLSALGHHVSVITFSNYHVPRTTYHVQAVSINGNSFTRQFRLLYAVWSQLPHVETIYIQGTIVVGLSALIGRLLNKRVVIKFVGDEVWEAQRQKAGKKEQTLEEYYDSKPKTLLLFVHRLILKTAHQIVVPSQYLKDFLVKYHQIHPNHISVIPNATEILTPKPPPAQAGSSLITKRAYKLVFVGRLVPWKHVDEIIHAVEIARKTHPWELTIVGDGPLASSLPKLPFITYRGQLSKDATLREIASSCALILYSSYEGHPHTVLEAHALGIPTIVSDIPPHQNLGSFAVAPSHNPVALAKAISFLHSAKKITPPTPPAWSDHLEKLVDVLED